MELKKTYKFDCRFFSGYKPCSFKRENCIGCKKYAPKARIILLIHLEAMGAVLQTTGMLAPLKRKYPESFLIWVTDASALPLLENNPLIDTLMPFNFDTYMSLKKMKFSLILNVDKSQKSAGLAMDLTGAKKMGFRMDGSGAIIPFNKESGYHYHLGLNDTLKFKKNRKTIQEYLAESFCLTFRKDEYILSLSPAQKEYIRKYKEEKGITDRDIVVGFNTGCSELYPNKKLDKDHIQDLIIKIHQDFPGIRIALFGGRAETERNEQIARSLPFPVINTPTTLGLRTGVAVMDIADIIVTGDTLGMHIGIGLKKEIVVWFNVSCSREIELYGRGEKVLAPVACSPCWKRECDSLVCFEKTDPNEIYKAVQREIEKVKTNKNTGHQA
ncbi:MAG: glycosyltransferase family 9 protein [bacterium]|nr:glycosyltransferase family 9 protein [bacterium]